MLFLNSALPMVTAAVFDTAGPRGARFPENMQPVTVAMPDVSIAPPARPVVANTPTVLARKTVRFFGKPKQPRGVHGPARISTTRNVMT